MKSTIDLTKETPLRIEEVAALFKVHRRTVENWFKRGLESVPIGRLVYTTKEAIQRFSEQNQPVDARENPQKESRNSRADMLAARRRHNL